MRERIREIIMQTYAEMGVHIMKGVLGRYHVHMFQSIPPKLSLPTSRQLTADRARRAMQKLADQPLTAAPIMLG